MGDEVGVLHPKPYTVHLDMALQLWTRHRGTLAYQALLMIGNFVSRRQKFVKSEPQVEVAEEEEAQECFLEGSCEGAD